MVADHEGRNTTFPKESKEELTLALAEVIKWEKDQKDLWIWERFSRLPFKILDRLTPKFIHDKLGKALDELGSYIQHGGRYLVSDESIYRLLQEKAQRTENLPKDTFPLPVMDAVSEDLASSRSKFATVQGATTGFGGIFTLAVDIPAVLGLALKVIQEIGLCYGYDPNLKEERVFTVKVMQFASSDIVGKRAILDELNTYVMAGQDSGQGEDTTVSRIQGWHEVITLYRDNWGWKKLFQMVPIAGMIFGAYINRGMLLDVAEAARMLYRKRRILTRLAELENSNMFQIRPIREEDIPFLWEMLYESLYVPEGGRPFPRDVIYEPSLSKYVEDWGRTGDYGYIAVNEQGERVGSVTMRFFKESSQGYGYVNEETPELNIAIIDAYRGKGIGTLLLESILEYGKAQQLPAISLSVDPNNYAVKLYERYGFHEIGMVDTSITMILELTN